VAAACASGNVALAQARAWLRQDRVDAVVVGAGDLWLTPLALACFGTMRVLSRRHACPEAASRPFDRDRDGFVPGEGAVVFVVEKGEAGAEARRLMQSWPVSASPVTPRTWLVREWIRNQRRGRYGPP
jgi:3-oxoacyl-[acyl-carrier-protein] synthase II